MFLIRWFGAVIAEVYGNMGIAIGLIFALVILLRPVTNTLLRPKHRVAFWIGAWTMGWSWSFWRMARLIRVLPVTFLGIIAAVLRQLWWRRGLRSTVLCAGIALVIYEMAVFVSALVSGLAPWSRIGIFLLTALYSWIVMVPLYPLASKIGKIGGEPWKE